LGDVWDALSSRLHGRTDFAPHMAERTVEEEPPPAESDESGDSVGNPDILAHATPIDLSSLEADSLALARLEELQPELALFSPSVWVLIRNHDEVENFLRASYLLEPQPEGSVAVMVWIDHRGSVEWAEISRSSGRSDLDEYALELFNEVARFRPAREQGVPVSISANFGLNFPF
jgi:TonB family protein